MTSKQVALLFRVLAEILLIITFGGQFTKEIMKLVEDCKTEGQHRL